jgi:hypothetical protein
VDSQEENERGGSNGSIEWMKEKWLVRAMCVESDVGDLLSS